MTFVKGQSGNAGGRPKDRPWTDALRRAINRLEADGKTKRIDSVADAVVKAAGQGDVQAAREIGDRLEGKPTQTLAGDPDAPLLPNGIAMIPVPPDAK